MKDLQENLQPTCNQLATDCISRQAVIDAVNSISRTDNWKAAVLMLLSELPSVQSEQCEFCKNRRLEDGDTLYISADWDGGIGFDFIRDIHYCPKCGRRL